MGVIGWRRNMMIDDKSLGMMDVSDKGVSHRTSEAEGEIWLKPETIKAIINGKIKKGDPMEVATVAGILAAKKTHELIPHCHQIPITSVTLNFQLEEDHVKATCVVAADYKTGVEMDALTGVTMALLTIWDMVKYLEKDKEGQYPITRISDVRVVTKTKG
jgi:cyclic pyranopterin phosphate synthase